MNQHQHKEVNVKFNEVLNFVKDERDCKATIEIDENGNVESFVYPINGRGVNEIYSIKFYSDDYEGNDEEYRNWLETCFMQELTAQKDEKEYVIKIKLI